MTASVEIAIGVLPILLFALAIAVRPGFKRRE